MTRVDHILRSFCTGIALNAMIASAAEAQTWAQPAPAAQPVRPAARTPAISAARPASRAPRAAPAAPRRPAIIGSEDQIRNETFEPRELLAHAADIGLTDDQRGKLEAEVRSFNARLESNLMPGLLRARSLLAEQLAARPVDEKRVNEGLDAVLRWEREVKQSQLAMLVRLKNMLSAEQVAHLQLLRKANDQKNRAAP
jgi:hypothetical protein